MTVGIKLGRHTIGKISFTNYESELQRELSSLSDGLQTFSYSPGSSSTEPFIYLDDYLKNDVEAQTPNAVTYDLSSRSTNPYQVRRKANKTKSSGAESPCGSVISSRNVNYNNLTPPQRICSNNIINGPNLEDPSISPEQGREKKRKKESFTSDRLTIGSSLEADEAVYVEMSTSLKTPLGWKKDKPYPGMRLSSFGKPNSPPNYSELISVDHTLNSIDYNSTLQSTRHNARVKFSPNESIYPPHIDSGRCSQQSTSSESSSQKSISSIASRLKQTIFGVLFELVTTERSYCNSLYVFSEVVAKTICAKTSVPLKDLRVLFPRSLPDIYSLHVDMLQQMERGIEGLADEDTLDDLLQADETSLPHDVLIHFLRLHTDQETCGLVCSLYTQYLDEFTCAMKTMQRLLRQSIRFRHTLKKLRDHPDCEGFDFAAFLLNPVQRLPRYLLLVKQLSKQLEKLTELESANSSINKALSTSREAECRLHEILVQLDTRLASYLQYPKSGGLPNGIGVIQDTMDKSIGLKRNKSLPFEVTKSPTQGVKKAGKQGIWPRLRRAFSEKRTENKPVVETPQSGTLSRLTSDRGDMVSSKESFETMAGKAEDDSDESQALTAACVEPNLSGIGSLRVPEEDRAQSVPPHVRLHNPLVSSNTQTTPGLILAGNGPSPNGDVIMGSVATRTPKLKLQTHQEIQVELSMPAPVTPEQGSKTGVNEPASKTEDRRDSRHERNSVRSIQSFFNEKSETSETMTAPENIAMNRPSRRSSLCQSDRDSSTESHSTSPSSSPTYSATLPRQPPRNKHTDKRVKSHTLLVHNELRAEGSKRFSLKKLFLRNADYKNSNPSSVITGDAFKKQPSTKPTSSPEVTADNVSELNQRTSSCFRIKSRHTQSTEFRPYNSQAPQSERKAMKDVPLDYSEFRNSQVYFDETGNVCFSV